jgi:hypothetical protein
MILQDHLGLLGVQLKKVVSEFFSFGNEEEEQLDSWMLMLLLHFCGIITCQLWSVQLGFKDMGADTLSFFY